MEKRLESISLVEFLNWEETQEHKHELLCGRIIAFSGGSLDHDKIRGNIYIALSARLRPPCRAYSSTVISETRTRKGNDGFRADVVVTRSVDDVGKALSVKHPSIIVEVLSPSNVGQEWTARLFEYWNTPSIEQLVITDSVKRSVASYIRDEQGQWQPEIASIGEGVLSFATVEVTMTLDEIYRGTSLDDRA